MIENIRVESGLHTLIKVEGTGSCHLDVKLELHQLRNVKLDYVGPMLPSNKSLFLVYLNRDNGSEYSQDWWYFNNDLECVSHASQVVSNGDGETIGGTRELDTDVTPLAQEKAFLGEVYKKLLRMDFEEYSPSGVPHTAPGKLLRQFSTD